MAKSPPPRTYRRWHVTPAGIVFFVLSAFVFIATVNSGVNVLYFALGMMVGTLIVSLILCSWSLRRIEITRDVGDHVIAGEPTDIIYAFRNAKRFIPVMAVTFRELHDGLTQAPSGFVMHLPAQPARGPRDATATTAGTPPVPLAARMTARRRGMLTLNTIELSSSFPLGVLRHTRRVSVPQEVAVYPRIGMLTRRLALEYREAVETGAMTSNRRGGNDEFYGVREYRAGDNVRVIHCARLVRTGRLMIREMAANAPPQLIVLLNLRGRRPTDTPDDIERAIELAAALVCYGFYENFAVGMAVAGLPADSESPAPRLGRDARAHMLRRLATLDPTEILPAVGINLPNRVAGRAQWVIVTLHRDDITRDLLPSGQAPQMGPPGGGGASNRTVLPLDAPDAGTWIEFLSAADTMRLLRERETT